jgi:transcriptional regulator with XRE-family HTH domain
MSTEVSPTTGWVPSDQSFGARLAMIRQAMGWNAKEAALACGLPQNSWRGWEAQSRSPRNVLDVVERIVERTGVDDYWLLTGRTKPRPAEPDGAVVRHQGLEPRTRWFVAAEGVTSIDAWRRRDLAAAA